MNRRYKYLTPGVNSQGKPKNDRDVLQTCVPGYENKFLYQWNEIGAYDQISLTFGHCENVAEFYKVYDNFPLSERYGFEIIQEGKQKIHFDLDFEYGDTEEYATTVRNNIIFAINTVFQEAGHHLATDNIILMTASGHDQIKNEFKPSYHVVIDGYALPNSTACKLFSKRVQELVPEEYKKYVDLSVNKPNQQFRMLGSQKPHSGRTKLMMKEWDYFGHKIVWNYPKDRRIGVSEKLDRLIMFERSLISHFSYEPTMIESTMFVPPEETKDYSKQTYEDVGEVDYDQWNKLIPEGWKLPTATGTYLRLIKTSKTECPICKRVHQSDNQFSFIVSESQKVFFKCCRATDEGKDIKLFLGEMKPELRKDEPLQVSIKPTPKSGRDPNHYTEKYVRPVELKDDSITLIKSYLGTGKTVEFIRQARLPGHERILILAPRRLYAWSVTNEYNKFFDPECFPNMPLGCGATASRTQEYPELKCYLDPKLQDRQDLLSTDQLVIQMESLFKLVDAPRYDLLILDEVESLLTQFSSKETMRNNLPKCVEVFEKLMKETPHIIGGDAFLGKRAFEVCKMFKPVNKIVNYQKGVSRRAIWYCGGKNTFQTMVYQAVQIMKSGRNIVFECASREKCLALKRMCQEFGFTYKCYVGKSENPEKDIEELKHVNSSWNTDPPIQCLIYNSVITVGVNFDVKGVFHQLFIYGSSFCNHVRDTMQGSLRVRHLIDDVVHVCCHDVPVSKSLPTTVNEVNEWMDMTVDMKKQASSIINDSPAFCKFKEENIFYKDLWQNAPQWLKLTHIHNIQESNQSKVYYGQVLAKYLKECNYTIQRVFPEKEIFLKKEQVPPRDTITSISDDAFLKLRDKSRVGLSTHSDYLMMERHRFDKMVSLDAFNPEDRHDIWCKFNDRTGKRHFYNLQSEKYPSDSPLKQEAEKTYIEFASLGPVKRQFVSQVCGLFGIQNSAEEFTIDKQKFNAYSRRLEPQIPAIQKLFAISSTSKDPDIFRKNIISKMFESWNGSKILAGRRSRTNFAGVTIDSTPLQKQNVQEIYKSLLEFTPPQPTPSNEQEEWQPVHLRINLDEIIQKMSLQK